MMSKQHLQTYQNNTVNTASGSQLTMMLYNGCIKFINQAIKSLNDNDYEAKNSNIQKAQDIIQELMLTLDQESEISKQILPLYEFIYYQLQQGNIKNEVEFLKEARTFVTDFRDTWKEVMKKESAPYVQGAQV
ncbi:MAG TPA: flagellar export chaperone FliS [Pseudogracilibacillus sp.]|nr:flagellar export chaperone FliS [Pseudogracilibacillus sp.]